jgi:hypothetical protein
MCISKQIKWIKKKAIVIFFAYVCNYKIYMKNVVECWKEFFAYFNAVET